MIPLAPPLSSNVEFIGKAQPHVAFSTLRRQAFCSVSNGKESKAGDSGTCLKFQHSGRLRKDDCKSNLGKLLT